jgi:DTW domain-containing protein YfiP
VVRAVQATDLHPVEDAKRPLFVLLDRTWSEARKMFRKSPCLDALAVLDLSTAQKSIYQQR